MKKIILIGGGGHCNSCIDVIESTQEFKIKGIVEKNESSIKHPNDYPIIGFDKDLNSIIKKNKFFFITLGQIKDPSNRVKFFKILKKQNIIIPLIISPKSYVSKKSIIGEGTIVMHFATINSKTIIGKNCIINSQALIEHDVSIGDHCHISTGAKINGSTQIGDKVFIGSGAIIYQGVKIKSNSIIPAGYIVKKDIK